ncbi:hypothetical protein SAMN05443637_108109 [Pseudonocardia thermophila]|uniref:DUF998 domain-containing protein n=1 Tax=Pseudonocardia thermophila TaxID=1848 RepID=A0A1M6TL50_PSETH|nr:hypothetical protein [Pseudonocardia thermophila]SHK57664.1 hypothetical protein SAMN05443637_108109 [Pseudonocardia thermophila]
MNRRQDRVGTDEPRRDLGRLALGIAVVLGFTAVAILATIVLAAAFDVDFDDLSRDPTSVFKGPEYAGWLSNLVAVVWLVPATCALFTAAVLRSARRSGAPMFLTAGLLGAVMAADDIFLGHEFLDGAIGLPTLVLPVIYGIGVVAFGLVFHRALGLDLLLLALAAVCWTAAVVIVEITARHGQLLPTALKLTGVGFWALLVVRLAFAALRTTPAEPEPEPDPEPAPTRVAEPVRPAPPSPAQSSPAPAPPAPSLADAETQRLPITAPAEPRPGRHARHSRDDDGQHGG